MNLELWAAITNWARDRSPSRRAQVDSAVADVARAEADKREREVLRWALGYGVGASFAPDEPDIRARLAELEASDGDG